MEFMDGFLTGIWIMVGFLAIACMAVWLREHLEPRSPAGLSISTFAKATADRSQKG